jgi:hypothetical protein
MKSLTVLKGPAVLQCPHSNRLPLNWLDKPITGLLWTDSSNLYGHRAAVPAEPEAATFGQPIVAAEKGFASFLWSTPCENYALTNYTIGSSICPAMGLIWTSLEITQGKNPYD